MISEITVYKLDKVSRDIHIKFIGRDKLLSMPCSCRITRKDYRLVKDCNSIVTIELNNSAKRLVLGRFKTHKQ
jgi:hypothetical protein